MEAEAANLDLQKELQEIKSELHYIKDHMIDRDMILSEEEGILLNRAREEYRKGETISLEKIEGRIDVPN